MKKDELRSLDVGHRVRWISGTDQMDGTVVLKRHGFAHIAWDDGGKPMVIGWRSRDDRARGKNLTRIELDDVQVRLGHNALVANRASSPLT